MEFQETMINNIGSRKGHVYARVKSSTSTDLCLPKIFRYLIIGYYYFRAKDMEYNSCHQLIQYKTFASEVDIRGKKILVLQDFSPIHN